MVEVRRGGPSLLDLVDGGSLSITISWTGSQCPPLQVSVGAQKVECAPLYTAAEEQLRSRQGLQRGVDVDLAREPAARAQTPAASAEARAEYYAVAPDNGQHEIWKREVAVALWRLIAGPSEPLARGWFELDGPTEVVQPPLFPLHTDACNAMRRLGLRRLVAAALGLSEGEASVRLAPGQFPVGGPFRMFADGRLLRNAALSVDELAATLMAEHESAVALAVARALAAEERRRASWNEAANGPFSALSEDEYRRYFSLTEADVDAWTRPDLSSCPPLQGLRLSADISTGASAAPRRTPATGAVIVEAPHPVEPEEIPCAQP